jgi:site-specific DNA-methyltransferase (adenine-specific)
MYGIRNSIVLNLLLLFFYREDMIKMVNCNLIHGDCLEEMDKLIREGQKVDLILTDPPYGTTACKWDTIIPLKQMWKCSNEITKPKTPVLLFGQEPFSSYLRLSNVKNYRYDWIWNKMYGANFLNANRMPLNAHEIISVFYKELPLYNPIKKYVGVKNKTKNNNNETIIEKNYSHNIYGNLKQKYQYKDDGYRYPISIITLNHAKNEITNSKRLHPTQKPVELLEYFIETYTNPNDTVLDFTMGSGSTGVACLQTNRNFIGIELEEKYYNIAKERCSNYQTKLM